MSTSTEIPITLAARNRRKGLLYLMVMAVGWGLNWPAMKFLLSEFPPMTMRCLSGFLAAACAIAVARRRGENLRPPRSQYGPLALFTALNFTAWMGLITVALLWLPASEAAIIAYTLPIWAVLMAWPILGETPTPIRLVALALGFGGVAILFAGQPIATSAAQWPGIVCVLAASILFALGSVLSKRRPLAMPPFAAIGWQVGLGTLPLLILALATETPDWQQVTPLGWAGIVWLATVPVIVAYAAWFQALQLVPASTAAISMLLVPVIGVFTSAIWLGEPLGIRQLAALALTVAGVSLASRT